MLNPQLDSQSKMLMVNHLFIQRINGQPRYTRRLRLPLVLASFIERGQRFVVVGTEVEEQLRRSLAGRVESSAHFGRVILDVAASLCLQL